MKIDQNGLNFIKSFEGCRLRAYRDIVGVLTIGYGYTGPDITPMTLWTQEQCDAALLDRVKEFEKCINTLVTVELNQHQFNALVSFVYNLGCNSLKISTLLKLLNAGDYKNASRQFVLWDHAGQTVLTSLLTRRKAEMNLFNT
jgi:lysozyme